MSAFVIKLISASRSAVLLDRAFHRASRGEDIGAWDSIKSLYKVTGDQIPSKNVHYQANILLSHVAQKLKNYSIAIAGIKVALGQLDDTNLKLTQDERQYFRYYLRAVYENCGLDMSQDVFDEAVRTIHVDSPSLNLSGVREELKLKFPVGGGLPSVRLRKN